MKQAFLLVVIITTCSFVSAQLPTTNRTTKRTGIDSLAGIKAVSSEDRAKIMNMVRLEGNKLVAQPGYTFTKVNENMVSLKNNGGSVSGNFSCNCKTGGGNCSLLITPESITCMTNPKCSKCELSTTIKGNLIGLNAIID